MISSERQGSAIARDEYVLGFSGLPLAYDFRRQALEALAPLTEAEARMCQGMDSAATILRRGRVIAAAEEERFTRQPHTHRFPVNAITCCLKQAGITIHDVSAITHGFDYRPYAKFYSQDSFSKQRYEQAYAPAANAAEFASHFPEAADIKHLYQPIAHHHAHAASAYYHSSFDEALVLVIDAMGEYYSTSVFTASKNKLTVLKQYDLLSSLGIFYSLITMHLGFRPNADEYKVMGLAPYGDPQRFLKILERCIEYRGNGTVFFPIYLRNRGVLSRETFRDVRQWFDESLFPPRASRAELTQDHADLAAALQTVLSRAVFHLLRHWCAVTHHRKLCIAGGVGFNCTVNGEILRSGLVEELYVPPAAGDAGVSVGSALYHYYESNPMATRYPAGLPFYGPEASEEDVHTTLSSYARALTVKHLGRDRLIQEVASLLSEGKVVAWMQGPMEFGPRALGNRSILADPRRADMKDIVNQMVKKREAFRPFAPSVKLDQVHVYFDVPPGQEHPYMLTTVQVGPAFRDRLPAVTHIDGSARLQTVRKDDHPVFWSLLDAFQSRAGLPVLLNTSFNVAGEAIVCTAQDALRTFVSTGLDALGIGDYLVLKLD